MDPGDDGLSQVSQRRPKLWELQWKDGLGRVVQPGLLGLFESVMGGAGEQSRTYVADHDAHFGERSRPMRKRAAGYSGRGRRSRQTTGRILLASSMAGSRGTLMTASTPISAIDASDQTLSCLTLTTIFMTTNTLSPWISSYASFKDICYTSD